MLECIMYLFQCPKNESYFDRTSSARTVPMSSHQKRYQQYVAKCNNTKTKNRIKNSSIDEDLVAQHGLEFRLTIYGDQELRKRIHGKGPSDDRRRASLYLSQLMISDN